MFRTLFLATLGYAAYRFGARIIAENTPGRRPLPAPQDFVPSADSDEQVLASAGIHNS
jgi:hypothetical protein